MVIGITAVFLNVGDVSEPVAVFSGRVLFLIGVIVMRTEGGDYNV